MKNIKIYFLLIIFTAVSVIANAQSIKTNEYGLKVVDNIASYKKLVEEDSTQKLVDLEKFIPGIKVDIRYATANNFMGEVMYPEAKAFCRLPAAEALKNVQADLKKKGLELKIYDAYRPYGITVKFYKKYKDTTYVASAWTGSRHNRGCAIDLSIIDSKTGKEVNMPTPFDDFTEKAHSDYQNLPKEKINNRELLKGLMVKYGFMPLSSEWWHFDYKDWKKYPLMDISFEQLERFNN